MADEKENLLKGSNDDMGYKNKAIVSTSDDESTNPALKKLVKEQALSIAQLRDEVTEEKTTNARLATQMDELSVALKTMSDAHSKQLAQMRDEMRSLRNGLEAKSELQASNIDELRFQVQSIRNKMDSKQRLANDTSANTSSPMHQRTVNKPAGIDPHLSPTKKIMFQNSSQDSLSSTGSNPCLMSRTALLPQRAEYVWRINAFPKKLKRVQSNAYDEPSRSEAFTTGPNGYRLSMWAYLNGRGKGQDKCLAVYVRVMGGEYDPILPWPVKPCYTFQLISQAQDPNKRLDLVRVRDLSIKHSGIARPQKDDKSVIVGFDDFIVHEDIEKKEYLLDDSLFIRCIVEM